MHLPTYTITWRIEKRLCKLYDFRLPAPLPVTWIGVFVGITVPHALFLTAVGLPFNHNPVWLYILPPGVLTRLATRPVIESKRLPELVSSQLRYVAEPRLPLLCFAPSVDQQIDAEGWTTVFTVAGLTLPDTTTSRDDYSYEQRLSVALLYLVSQFARKLLNGIDRPTPKAIFLDEAWAITSTPEGAKLVSEVSRMGRSRYTALVLVPQNAGDLLNEKVTSCLSRVFAFRLTERGEVTDVMSLLGVAPLDEHKAVLRSLGSGECISRDLDDRAGRIGIDLVSDELRDWINTDRAGRRSPGHHCLYLGQARTGALAWNLAACPLPRSDQHMKTLVSDRFMRTARRS